MMKKIIFILSLKNRWLFTFNIQMIRILVAILKSYEIKDYIKKVKYRRELSIFSIFNLSESLNKDIREYYIENSYYGNSLSLNNKLNTKGKIKGVIEHGVYFGENVNEEEVKYSPFKTIYTFGQYRKNILEKYLRDNKISKKVETIGPYIIHATDYLEKDEYNKLKKELGKVLLVFPSHSIPGVVSEFAIKDLVDEINNKRDDFDTVLISMYWKDVQNGKHIPYEEAGFKIVTAGHINDENFLSRLKLVIKLSDMTMSNQLGTHLGYCIALGKPHWLFSQSVSHEGRGVKSEFKRPSKWKQTYEQEKLEFQNYFGKYNEKITKEQIKIVQYYWGCFK